VQQVKNMASFLKINVETTGSGNVINYSTSTGQDLIPNQTAIIVDLGSS